MCAFTILFLSLLDYSAPFVRQHGTVRWSRLTRFWQHTTRTALLLPRHRRATLFASNAHMSSIALPILRWLIDTRDSGVLLWLERPMVFAGHTGSKMFLSFCHILIPVLILKSKSFLPCMHHAYIPSQPHKYSFTHAIFVLIDDTPTHAHLPTPTYSLTHAPTPTHLLTHPPNSLTHHTPTLTYPRTYPPTHRLCLGASTLCM